MVYHKLRAIVLASCMFAFFPIPGIQALGLTE